MTKFGTSAWEAKAKKRKAVRDHYREKFFVQNNVITHSDPLKFSGAPKSQRKRILKLMKITKKGGALSSDQEQMMSKLAIEMLRTGLGVGAMGGVCETKASFEDYSFTRLQEFFY